MAQKVHVILEDDLDGSEASETVNFSLDNVQYEIDLNEKNAAALRKALDKYVGAARKVSTARRKPSGSASSGGKRTDLSDVRAWAKDNGFSVSERGRVSQEVLAAYDAR